MFRSSGRRPSTKTLQKHHTNIRCLDIVGISMKIYCWSQWKFCHLMRYGLGIMMPRRGHTERHFHSFVTQVICELRINHQFAAGIEQIRRQQSTQILDQRQCVFNKLRMVYEITFLHNKPSRITMQLHMYANGTAVLTSKMNCAAYYCSNFALFSLLLKRAALPVVLRPHNGRGCVSLAKIKN